MYVIKLGHSYMADYVGCFEDKRTAEDWIENNGFDPNNCFVIAVHLPATYDPIY